MNAATYLRDAALPVRFQTNANVEIWQTIERRQAVQKIATFCAIHASEHHVAFLDLPHCVRIDEILLEDYYLSPEANAVDFAGYDFHLRTPGFSIFHRRVQNSIEVLFFHDIRID